MAPLIIRPVTCPVLIGRAPYLDAIAATLASIQHGAGSTLLVSGEAGIGKSRLLAEAADQAARLGVACLLGNAYEADRDVPFAPLTDLLRGMVAACADDDLRRVLDATSGPYLVHLLPELADRSSKLADGDDPDQQKRRLYAALDETLLGLARDRPALIGVEDVHWADETSLNYLLHLARRIARMPILLVITYRSDEVHPALRHFLAGLDRERLATEAALRPLVRPEVSDMIRATFGVAQSPRADLLAALYELTEGNPFFIEEVLHTLVAAGDVFYDNGRWDRKPLDELHIPRSVHDSVQRRAQGLSAEAAQVLNLAAVLGRRFDFALLQTVGGYDEARLLDLLKELIAAQLLVEESDERYRFRHALTRQAVYAELLAGERRRLHRTVADALERLAGDSPDTALPELAYHYFAGGVWDKALAYSQRLGERALGLFSPGAAVEHFTRALEAARRQNVTPPLEVLRSRGAAYETLGEFERARGDYERALALAREADDWRAEWELLRDFGVLWTGRDYAQAGAYYRLAHERAQASGDSRLIARSLNSLGNWLLNVNETVEARRHHEEALAVFEALGDQHGVAETLDLLGMTLYLSGDLVNGTRTYERGVALMRELNERKLLASALATMPMRGMTWQGDAMVPAAENLAAALVEGWEGLAVAREIGWSAGEAYAQMVLAYGLDAQGEYGAALDHLSLGERIAGEIEHRQWLTGFGCVRGALLFHLFALDDAHATLAEALRQAREIGSGHWISCIASFLARCYVQRGMLDQAEAMLDSVQPTDKRAPSLGQRLEWRARVEVALARGQAEVALRLADELAAVTPHAEGPNDIPRLSWLRGQALATLGQLEEAERSLLAAESHAARHGALPLLWRIQADLCSLARARGQDQDAERESSIHWVLATLAQNIPDSQMRKRFLAGAYGMLPAVRSGVPQVQTRRRATPGGLTLREREVAALVAEGLGNRAIAERLVVGERTVETHVAHILDKLGFMNRAQIAAWAVAHEVTGQEPDSTA